MMIINRITGKEPTEAEMKAIRQRAIEIYQDPYAAPEQLQWAIEVYPEGFAQAFDLSNRSEYFQDKALGKTS